MVKRTFYLLMHILICSMFCVSISAQTQEVDDLQEYINNLPDRTSTRSCPAEIEVDLSQFSSTNRKEPLVVNGNKNYKFVNGTLRRSSNFDGPLLSISGDSRVVIGRSAVLYNGGYLQNPVVKVSEGVLKVSEGGRIWMSDATHSGTNTSVMIESGKLFIDDGFVDDVIYGDICDAYLVKGAITELRTSSEVTMSGDFKVGNGIYLNRNDIKIAVINCSIANPLVIYGRKDQLVLSSTYGNSSYIGNPTVYSIDELSGGGYILTKADAKKVKVYYNDSYATVHYVEGTATLEGNSIYIREKKNDASDPDWLQKQLDDIASKGTSSVNNPATIEIPTNGIEISKTIYVRANCHAIIKGGAITVSSSFPSSGEAFQIMENGSISFVNALNFNNHAFAPNAFVNYGYLSFGSTFSITGISNQYSVTRMGAFINMTGGTLEIESGEFSYPSVLINCVNGNMASIYIRGGRLETTGSTSVIEGDASVILSEGQLIGHYGAHYVVNVRGEFNMSGGVVQGATNNCLVHADRATTHDGGRLIGGYVTDLNYGSIGIWSNSSYPTFDVPQIDVYNTARINGFVDLSQTRFYLYSTADLQVKNRISDTWNIDGEWSKMNLGKVIASGYSSIYTLTEADFQKMNFLNLPSDVEAYYDSSDKTVKLRKKQADNDEPADADDLQDFINKGPKGTEEDPIEIPIGPKGYDIDHDVDFDDIQAYIDGRPGWDTWLPAIGPGSIPENPMIALSGGNIRINKNAGLTLRNVELDGKSTKHYINVYGKLIIDINVIVNYFNKYFIIVRPGGKLVWRGGNASIPGIVVYNDGGTVEYHEGIINSDKEVVQTVNGGKIYIKGGTIDSNIKTEGDIYIDGNSKLADIYLGKDALVYITSKLKNNVRLHFIETYGFTLDGVIVSGADGYTLTNNDKDKITIDLPDGYYYEYVSSTHQIVIRKSGGTSTMTIKVKFSADGYATLYDSKQSYILPTGFSAYIITSADEKKVVMYQIAGGNTNNDILPKGVAVLLQSKDKAEVVYTLTGTDKTVSINEENLLKGSDTDVTTTASGNCLFYKLTYGKKNTNMSNVFGWFWGAKQGVAFQIEAHRAWLAIPKTSGARTRGYSLNGDILDVVDDPADDNELMYDLNGRMLQNSGRRGLFIKDGQKVLVK